MKTITFASIIFISVISVFCLLAWLGGFNFDARNENVCFVAALSLVCASIASWAFYISKTQ